MENTIGMGKVLDKGFTMLHHEYWEYDLNPNEFSVWLYLLKCAGQDGSAFPKYKKISEKCKIKSDATISKILDSLEEKGLMERSQPKGQRRRTKMGRLTSNRYIVHQIPQLQNLKQDEPTSKNEEGSLQNLKQDLLQNLKQDASLEPQESQGIEPPKNDPNNTHSLSLKRPNITTTTSEVVVENIFESEIEEIGQEVENKFKEYGVTKSEAKNSLFHLVKSGYDKNVIIDKIKLAYELVNNGTDISSLYGWLHSAVTKEYGSRAIVGKRRRSIVKGQEKTGKQNFNNLYEL